MHPKCPPFFCRFSARIWCKFSYFTNSELTLGVKFIFIISLMHTLSDKVMFVQRKLKPEEAFRTKKWMVLAEHLLAQAHIVIYKTCMYTHACKAANTCAHTHINRNNLTRSLGGGFSLCHLACKHSRYIKSTNNTCSLLILCKFMLIFYLLHT